MDKSTSMLRLQVWTERVRECHNSGMTVKDEKEDRKGNQLPFLLSHKHPIS